MDSILMDSIPHRTTFTRRRRRAERIRGRSRRSVALKNRSRVEL
jgi:hypothetical protein